MNIIFCEYTNLFGNFTCCKKLRNNILSTNFEIYSINLEYLAQLLWSSVNCKQHTKKQKDKTTTKMFKMLIQDKCMRLQTSKNLEMIYYNSNIE